ncbi:hypothetical protein [Epilithonimonas hominis]|uniref:hypothetical protein n=1 Tax=Epilithonimonas hominis TaxID=420404 RepID=UPI0028982BC2|nr:hypothetical protein [Epilithonimonas hominis]
MKYFLLLLFSSVYYFSQDVDANLRNQTFSAKVIGISDGDTMEVLFNLSSG